MIGEGFAMAWFARRPGSRGATTSAPVGGAAQTELPAHATAVTTTVATDLKTPSRPLAFEQDHLK
jgi:hypothetical protein